MLLADGTRLSHADLMARMAALDLPVRLAETDVVLTTWLPDGGCGLLALVGLGVPKGALVVAADGADLAGTTHDFGVTVVTSADGTLERVG
ncbi:hypothetical protein ACWDA3_31940 [Nonomuraea rubra]